jgi:PKD repeat protein
VRGPGGEDTKTRDDYILVYAAPQANFWSNLTSGPAPLMVTFNNASSSYDRCWWEFGDGTSSDACNPTHTYTTAGLYTVRLTVEGPGGSDTMLRPNFIRVEGEAIQADFSASPTSGQAPLTVKFTNQSTGDYTACTWLFGDGESSTDCDTPSHTYAAGPRIYAVSLTVYGPGGSDTETKSQYIIVLPANPVAAFTAAPTSGPTPLTVQFTDQSTSMLHTWAWDFGDGATSSDQNPIHTYQTAGQ